MEPPFTGMEPHRDRHLPYKDRLLLRWRARILIAVGIAALVVLLVQGGSWLADKRYCDDPMLPSGPPAAFDVALAVYEDRCGTTP